LNTLFFKYSITTITPALQLAIRESRLFMTKHVTDLPLLLTTKDASEILGITPKTYKAWVKKKAVPACNAKTRRIHRDRLLSAISGTKAQKVDGLDSWIDDNFGDAK